jgi:E3 ubiquitin-protein ligase SH3RF
LWKITFLIISPAEIPLHLPSSWSWPSSQIFIFFILHLCNQVIVASHKDRPLICPECRLTCPPNIKVDDLPPNVLLCRIIEGMKSTNLSKSVKTSLNQQQTVADATTPAASCTQQQPLANIVPQFGQHTTGSSNNATGTTVYSPLSPQQPILHPRVPTSQQSAVTTPSLLPNVSLSQIKDWRSVPHAKALFDFHSRENGDLSFKRGDLIILKKRIDHNWAVGESNGKEGVFPINHVQVLVALPTPKCKALYDFQMKPNEEEGCLVFKKGQVIQVIRRVDQNWAEGRLGETIGIFPISFVEMNLLARQLMTDASLNKSMPSNARTCPQPPVFDQNLSDSSTTTTSTTSPTSENTTTSSNSSTAPNSPVVPAIQPPPSNLVRIRETKHDKRHSLTALMANGQNSNILMASNRHSAEILGIPDVTSLAINGGNNSSSNNNNKAVAEPKIRLHPQQQRAKKLIGGSRELFVALYPYKPQKPDELELKKGCECNFLIFISANFRI